MNNLYIPRITKVLKNEPLTPSVNLITLQTPRGFFRKSKMAFSPGQFILISIFGFGEATFALTLNPQNYRTIKIAVRNTGGVVTSKLTKLKTGDTIGLRGPFGNSFLDFDLENKDLILVAGGTALAPISALVEYICNNRKKFQNVYLLYGAKTPEDLIFKKYYSEWKKKINILTIVEIKTANWYGPTGFVTGLCQDLDINPFKTKVIMCGPPPMLKPVIEKLHRLKIADRQILISLEARLRCGIGKCQHCTCGENYVCLDGPVFEYGKVKNDI